MISYIIRDYKSDDYESLVMLWRETGMGGPERGDTQTIIEQSIDLGGRLLIMEASSDNSLIGTSWMTFDGRRIHLHHFGILKKYQGKGLSKALVDESLRHIKKEGYQAKLEVHKENDKAIQLYMKSGFTYLGDYNIYIIRKPEEIDI